MSATHEVALFEPEHVDHAASGAFLDVKTATKGPGVIVGICGDRQVSRTAISKRRERESPFGLAAHPGW
jgi:hypothetical protein